MKCPQCSQILIWQSDFEYEDHGIDDEGIIGIYICPNDKCNIEQLYIFTLTDATL